MPSKKLTAQKRAELKVKKAKQIRKGTTGEEKNNMRLYATIGIIVVVIIAGIYLAFGTKTTDETDNDDNGNVVTNTDPVAVEDYIVVGKNVAQSKIDFQANDNDPDGDSLNVTSLGDPSNGIFETVDGITYYTPTEDFTGTETVEYTIDDGMGGSATSTIHIIVVDPDGNSIALFDTSMGKFAIELYEDKAPITTKNFIDHANNGYYDGLIFHRVISGFMIQGGDPFGTGTGGHAAEYHEGYGNPDNPDSWVIPDEFHDDLKHDSAGILSMANSGADTGGSQFFITAAETPWLDGAHSVFGKVIEGIAVVYAISEVETSNDRPLTDVVMNITIKNN